MEVIFFVFYVLLIYVTCAAAEVRDRNVLLYFFGSVLFSPVITLIHLLVTTTTIEAPIDGKICPYCAEIVKHKAIICKHCHINFRAEGISFINKADL